MKFSENWLKTWVDPQRNSEQLATLLTMAGLEVEGVLPAASLFSSVVVAEVKSVRPHENADRLRVTEVDVGQGALVQIVCGAPNVQVGIKVPCALPGACLPGDFKIKPTKMRGVESNGMLCSGKELGIPDDVDGLLVLPEDAPVGQDIRTYLALDDQIFELKITPNRADCLSIKGIAREVAALTGSVLNAPELSAYAPNCDEQRRVQLNAGSACSRYLGQVIRGVNAQAKTPLWLSTRLARAGLRSISAIVDVTNYVLLELGQPLHAFDHDKLQGDITVRWAEAQEPLTLLNGKTIALDSDMLVIADRRGPVALAGIMGGAQSEVDTNTQTIFLESAFFAPDAIAGRARRLGFSSDASFRYERGVDFMLQRDAIERATTLILDICGGQAGPVNDSVTELPTRMPVAVRTARVNRLLGLNLNAEMIATIFTRLGFIFHTSEHGFSVMPPSFRFDIAIEEDLIEEVARVVGYDTIPATNLHAASTMLPLPEEITPRGELRRAIAARDYQEMMSYAFVDVAWEANLAGNANPIKLLNPIASQMSVMRSSLFGSLLNTLRNNLNRQHARVRLFEIARVFLRTETGVEQPERVAGLAFGSRVPEQWGVTGERVDFFDVKADIETWLAPRCVQFRVAKHPALHPGRCAEIILDEVVVGVLGELHPQWVQADDLPSAPILFELDAAILSARTRISAKPVSKFQAVRRDMAFVVADEVASSQLLASLQRAASPQVTEITLFDVYQGKGVPDGKKSLAFKVLLQDTGRTLTDEDVEIVMAALLEQASREHGATLRV